MAATINTNIASINAQRNLALSGQSLNTTMQRLSSGLRVNSAKDDAAGLAIAERMNTQVKGLTVAARNANDGISLAQTAEGALGKVGDMLQRMRELAVQASNATNSDSDRAALQAEVSQLAAEIDRVAKQTNFNGQKILDGSFAGAVFQVGANSGDNVTLGALADTRANQISNINYASEEVVIDTNDNPIPTISNFNSVIDAGELSITIGQGTDAITVPLEKIEPANSSLERLGQVITAINNKTADTGVTAFMTMKEGTSEYTVTLMSSKLDAEGLPLNASFNNFSTETTGIRGGLAPTPSTYISELQTASSPFNKTGFDAALNKIFENNPALKNHVSSQTAFSNYEAAGDSPAPGVITAVTNAFANTANKALGDYQTLITEKTKFDADPSYANASTYRTALNKFLATGDQITLPTLANWSSEAGIKLFQSGLDSAGVPSEMNITKENFKLNDRGIEDIDVTTQAGAWVALKKIDSAVDQVNSARATLGAMQTRFENAVNNIDIQVENLSAARGRIVDADFAVETANLSRTQILQQAGTAMVAQANQIPQNVLQLLQG